MDGNENLDYLISSAQKEMQALQDERTALRRSSPQSKEDALKAEEDIQGLDNSIQRCRDSLVHFNRIKSNEK